MKYLITGDTIVIQRGIFDILTVSSTEEYNQVKKYLSEAENPDYEEVKRIINNYKPTDRDYEQISDKIKKDTLSDAIDMITIVDKQYYINGNPVPSQFSDIVTSTLCTDEVDLRTVVTSLKLFLDNLNQNPDDEMRSEVLDFILKGKLPLTSKGTFLAYKAVTSTMYDKFTGHTNEHKIGKEVSMDRDKVTKDRTLPCSSGLHVCAKEYLSPYSNLTSYGRDDDVYLVVEVNPKNVVSIPYDYDLTKMRVCAYIPLQIIEPYTHELISSKIVDTEKSKPEITTMVSSSRNTPFKQKLTIRKYLDNCGSFTPVAWSTRGRIYHGWAVGFEEGTGRVPANVKAIDTLDTLIDNHPEFAELHKKYKVIRWIKDNVVGCDRVFVVVLTDKEDECKILCTSRVLD